MTATIHGRAQDAHMEIAADPRRQDARPCGSHYVQDCGSYLQLLTPTIAHLTLFMAPGAYDIQAVDITVTEVFTNTMPDRRLPRRRPARGDPRDRADDGHARRRGRDQPRGGAPPQLHHASSRTPARPA